jgi:hypothetical protein
MLASAVLLLLVSAEPTPSPTPTVTPTPAPTAAATEAPTKPSRYFPTYGQRLPGEPRSTPTATPNALSSLAARVKLRKTEGGISITDKDVRRSTGTFNSSGAPGAVSYIDVGAAKLASEKLCKSEWPDDLRMEAYCRAEQAKAIDALNTRTLVPPVPAEAFAGIRTHCKGEWPDDYRMRDYCETEEIKAYQKLHPQS